MKILYDHQMFTMQRFGGVTRYFAELINNLPDNFDAEVSITYSENAYLTGKYKYIDFIKNFRVKRRFYYLPNEIKSNKMLKANKFDVFHPTYYNPYFLKRLQKPFVLTIHDMVHERFPNLFPAYDRTIRNKALLASRAAQIIAVSENTKRDIVDILNINPDKITVIHHGYKVLDAEKLAPLFQNYLLFVGARKQYKNFIPFVTAILPLLKEDKTLKIVCTGADFSKSEIIFFETNKIQQQIIHIGASDAELRSLYQNALAFVFPSLYEGFGIPVLEAFANNCPVCLSRASCFPEVAADAALYFDPKNYESILNNIGEVIKNQDLRHELIEKGRRRVAEFTIEKMVAQTCQVYQKAQTY